MKKITKKYLSLFSGVALTILSTGSIAYQYIATPIIDNSKWAADNSNASVSTGVVILRASGVVDGPSSWARVKTDSVSDAFYATFTITDANCPGACTVRLRNYLGWYNGNALRVVVGVSIENGEYRRVFYRLSERDPVDYHKIRTPAHGYIGEDNDEAWSVGSPIGIAIGIKGNELIFYGENEGTITKIELPKGFVPLDEPRPWEIDAFTEEASDKITAVVSGFLNVELAQ